MFSKLNIFLFILNGKIYFLVYNIKNLFIYFISLANIKNKKINKKIQKLIKTINFKFQQLL